MKYSWPHYLCRLGLGILSVLPSATAQNLLTNNPGFEVNTAYYTPAWGFPEGNPDALPGWFISLDATGDGYAGAAANQSPPNLEGNHFGYIYSGTGFAGVLETAPGSRAEVEPGETYDLWFLARGDATWSDAAATVSLGWHPNRSNGTTSGQSTNLDLTLPPKIAPEDPLLQFHLTATAPAGAHYASVRIERPAYDYTPIIFDDFVIMRQPAAITLTVKKQGTNILLSWPRSAQFKLQTTSDPANPGNWRTVTKPPKGVGAMHEFLNPFDERAGFFRLSNEP